MDWPSFWIGVAVIPGSLLVTITVGALISRAGNRGTKCDSCSWGFAGLAENYGRLRYPSEGKLRHPFLVHALLSTFWHDAVITRGRKHRASWMKNYLGKYSSSNNPDPRLIQRYGIPDRSPISKENP